MSISVVLPAYDEVENLKILFPRLNEELIKIGIPFEVLVIDAMEKTDIRTIYAVSSDIDILIEKAGIITATP